MRSCAIRFRLRVPPSPLPPPSRPLPPNLFPTPNRTRPRLEARLVPSEALRQGPNPTASGPAVIHASPAIRAKPANPGILASKENRGNRETRVNRGSRVGLDRATNLQRGAKAQVPVVRTPVPPAAASAGVVVLTGVRALPADAAFTLALVVPVGVDRAVNVSVPSSTRRLIILVPRT